MEYSFKNMIENAQRDGLVNENTMWKSVERMNDILCLLKREHPEKYWEFMREQHGIMYHDHYDESFAMYDISNIRYVDEHGMKHTGAHWTCEQIETATKNMSFPSGTNKWDKFVAFNSFYADTCKVLDEESIIEAAHVFYFADEDAPSCKIWKYMQAMKECCDEG